jgi:hypothetical protein
MYSSLLVAIALTCMPNLVWAWALIDNFNADNWQSSMWLQTVMVNENSTVTNTNPVQGTSNNEYVNYLTLPSATDSGLIQNRNGQLYIGVDTSTVLNPNGVGRNAIRLHSNNAYNSGTLVIGDFAHIPSNICGIWPSFWMVGPSWPQDGEIDILEGVNQNALNQITLHTSPGCVPSMSGTGSPAGNADCGTGGGGVGCGAINTNGNGWGSNFNYAGGGVYAMEWTSSAISVWFFQQGQVPGDISNNAPNPAGWGTPVASWTGCNFGSLMDNMNIVCQSESSLGPLRRLKEH